MTDPTEPDQIRPPEVSDRQSIAIDALVSGATQQEAAEKAGVQRTTVTAWCNHNLPFIAERNQRREDRVEAAGERLQETLCAALEHLGERVREGDTGAAMTIVKAVGVGHLLNAVKPGPTDPAVVRTNLAKRCEAEVMVELLTGSEFAGFVQERSDQSAG
jgi:hypothetical protein